jgi:hypothetical protein
MTAPGQIARRILGKYFEPFGNAYRRIFVDLDRVVEFYDREVPEKSRILDVGGGDGAVIERLLDRRPDLLVTMTDLAENIGQFISERNRPRVNLLPKTSIEEMSGQFDIVMISDVLHHVPPESRGQFFAVLASACERLDSKKLIFKDVEPKGVRSFLALLADRYITGDRHVSFPSRKDFGMFAELHFPHASRKSHVPDWPNYCEVLTLHAN